MLDDRTFSRHMVRVFARTLLSLSCPCLPLAEPLPLPPTRCSSWLLQISLSAFFCAPDGLVLCSPEPTHQLAIHQHKTILFPRPGVPGRRKNDSHCCSSRQLWGRIPGAEAERFLRTPGKKGIYWRTQICRLVLSGRTWKLRTLLGPDSPSKETSRIFWSAAADVLSPSRRLQSFHCGWLNLICIHVQVA